MAIYDEKESVVAPANMARHWIYLGRGVVDIQLQDVVQQFRRQRLELVVMEIVIVQVQVSIFRFALRNVFTLQTIVHFLLYINKNDHSIRSNYSIKMKFKQCDIVYLLTFDGSFPFYKSVRF